MDKNLEAIKDRATRYIKSNTKSLASKSSTNNKKIEVAKTEKSKKKIKKTYNGLHYYYEFPAGIRN